ncbi:MAG: pilus (MSHA type) biogenesis protein MshL [Pseudomonadota bacterium]
MTLNNMMRLGLCCVSLAGCAGKPIQPSNLHIQQAADQVTADNIPQPLTRNIVLPPPKVAPKAETYSVVVANVPAQEILFALARDAKINLDIHPGIEGAVTINAINQTLPQILDRIAKQVEMRYEIDNGNLIVMPDAPYLHSYKIDYINMARESDGSISGSSLIGGGSLGGSSESTSGSAGGGNSSSLAIKSASKNHFWETLIQNIKDILHETDKILPAGSSETSVQQTREASSTGTGAPRGNGKKSAPDSIENSPNPVNIEEGGTTITRRSTFREAASVIANPENGIITVRATGKQHANIQKFIDQVMVNARRQVLIEATIVEVRLSDEYQQGIDWSRVRLGGAKGFNLTQLGTAGLPATNTGSMFKLGYLNPTSKFGNLSANISLLESFGNVRVLSSPKLSVMNNQTAVLRVVDNLVYFTVKADTTTNQTSSVTTFTTTPHTVPVGLTMSVTPQINDGDTVLLNLRPSITRLLTTIPDPNPSLTIANGIPQTQTREMESVLRIENNQIAVMGGLMQDSVNNATDSIPGVSNIPFFGNLFKNKNNKSEKTELVIFLRPVVIKDASLNGDFSDYRTLLPDQNFFQQPAKTQ